MSVLRFPLGYDKRILNVNVNDIHPKELEKLKKQINSIIDGANADLRPFIYKLEEIEGVENAKS